MYNLGLCLQVGEVTEENADEALIWFEKAAVGGYSDAMYLTAVLYANTHKYDLSFKWYKKGAETGHVTCMNDIGACYEEGARR